MLKSKDVIKINLDLTQFINISNIFRIQEYDSIKCGYFCIGFIGFYAE